jgi:single-strand DNA-binding protein
MAGVNKVIILGNLGADPELRSSPSGVTSCRLSIATSMNWTDKASGEKKDKTEWHRVVFFGRSAEVIDQYLKKGQQLYIEGRLQTNKYEKDGIERYSTDIIGESFNFISGSGSSSTSKGAEQAPNNINQDNSDNSSEKASPDEFEDDIPF